VSVKKAALQFLLSKGANLSCMQSSLRDDSSSSDDDDVDDQSLERESGHAPEPHHRGEVALARPDTEAPPQGELRSTRAI
jgi:hypothetical protein